MITMHVKSLPLNEVEYPLTQGHIRGVMIILGMVMVPRIDPETK